MASSCFERDRLRRWKGLRTFLWSKCKNICATKSCSIMKKLSRPNIDVCYSANGFESCINLWTSSKAWLLYKRQLKSGVFYHICNRQKKIAIMSPAPVAALYYTFLPFLKIPSSCSRLFAPPLSISLRDLFFLSHIFCFI